jgi:hypothetical protein
MQKASAEWFSNNAYLDAMLENVYLTLKELDTPQARCIKSSVDLHVEFFEYPENPIRVASELSEKAHIEYIPEAPTSYRKLFNEPWSFVNENTIEEILTDALAFAMHDPTTA